MLDVARLRVRHVQASQVRIRSMGAALPLPLEVVLPLLKAKCYANVVALVSPEEVFETAFASVSSSIFLFLGVQLRIRVCIA